MHKCYTFLIFMVLLLPSLGLSRWVQREGMGAGAGGVSGREEGVVQAPTSPTNPSTPCLGGILRGSWRGLPSLFQPPPPLSSSPAWTSSSAGSLTRNSWLRQLFGLSE